MLEVRLLGTPEISSNGAPLELVSMRAQSLLAYLILQDGRAQRRDYLAFLLWPDSTEKQARTNLRKVLHTLRTTIPEAERFLQVTQQTLCWQGSWTDVAAFDAAVQAVEPERAGPERAGPERVKRLREAVDLYRGELLHGWYDDWLLPERDRLRRLVLAALAQLTSALDEAGDSEAAIGYAERALAIDPMAEPTYQILMRLYDARGDRGRALRLYHECTAKLRDELGVEPSAATAAAYQALLPPERDEVGVPRTTEATALVGRPAERRQLTELWQDCRRGRAPTPSRENWPMPRSSRGYATRPSPAGASGWTESSST